MTNKMSVIVMTVIGDVPRCPPSNDISNMPAPSGFCWRFVPEGQFAVQIRSILRLDARAVVVWVGADDAIDRAAKLIDRILGAGLPIVIAVAEVHDPSTESVLRQAALCTSVPTRLNSGWAMYWSRSLVPLRLQSI